MKDNILDKAMSLLLKKDYPRAQQLLEDGIRESLKSKDPQRAATYYLLLGQARWADNDLQKALEAFQRGEQLLPHDPAQKVETAYFYFIALGDKEKALEKAEEVLRTDSKRGAPTHRALQLKGLIYFEDRQYDQAAKMLRASAKVRVADVLTALGFELALVKKCVESGIEPKVSKEYLKKAILVAKKGKRPLQPLKTLLEKLHT